MAKNYNKRKETNPDQMVKRYGKGVFIEFIQPNPDFEKVTVNLVSFDEETKKQTGIVSTYFDIPVFTALCNKIITGRLGKRIVARKQEAEKAGEKYPKSAWEKQGGKRLNENTTDATAWKLDIAPGSKVEVVFTGRKGMGTALDSGLIRYNYSQNDTVIRVGMSFDDLDEVASICLLRLQAYITSRQLAGDYDRKPYENGNSDNASQPQPQQASTPTQQANEVYDYEEPATPPNNNNGGGDDYDEFY